MRARPASEKCSVHSSAYLILSRRSAAGLIPAQVAAHDAHVQRVYGQQLALSRARCRPTASCLCRLQRTDDADQRREHAGVAQRNSAA